MINRLVEAGYSFQHPAVLNDFDVEALLQIERDAFPIDYYNKEQLLEEYEKNPLLFIVSRDKTNTPVGYISGDIKGIIGSIVSIAVRKDLRSLGIGSCLNRLMVDYLESMGTQTLQVHTREDNQGSVRLFERFGFAITDRVEGYYRDGSPALVMKTLMSSTSEITG